MSKKLTSRKENYSEWYNEIIAKANLTGSLDSDPRELITSSTIFSTPFRDSTSSAFNTASTIRIVRDLRGE